MSYIIDFYISCPMCLPETSPRLHSEIQMVQGPGQTPAFSYPSGCPRFDGCQACVDCYREIFRRFQSGEINFYKDPRAVNTVMRATIPKLIRPTLASMPPESV